MISAILLVSVIPLQLSRADDTPLACPFCTTPLPAGAFFCPHCGRLSRTKGLEPAHRFWGDAFYVLEFPPALDRPSLSAEVNPQGLSREAVSSYSGERYALEGQGKKTGSITGEVLAWGTSKGVTYRATVTDSYDGDGRLVRREMHGVVKADPTRHIYRKLEYAQVDGRLDHIDIATWLYRSDSDWEKRPSEWIRHERADIHLIYTGAELSRIETTRREGKKGLRGNLEYTDLAPTAESVQIDAGFVIGIKPVTP